MPDLKTPYSCQGGGQIHPPCSARHQATKFSQIFSIISFWSPKLIITICEHACMHSAQICTCIFFHRYYISRIGDFEKMAITPLKKLKTTWLSQSCKFFGWFWGGLYSSLFYSVQYFFGNWLFLIFRISQILTFSFQGALGGPWEVFLKKIALIINLRPFEEFTDTIP